MSRSKMFLSFRRTECQCGEERLYGQACQSCGRRPKPTEIDSEVQRRQQLVQFTRRAIDEVRAGRVGARPADIQASMRVLLERSGHALGLLIVNAERALDGIGDTGFEKFASGACQLATFGPESERLTGLRPARALRTPFMSLAAAFSDVLESLLAALEAVTIEGAQRHRDGIQPAIDAATAAVAESGEVLAAWSAINNSDDPLTTLIGMAFERSDGADLLDLASIGQEEVAQRFSGVQVPVEHGLLVSLLSSQAAMLHDTDSFWATSKRVFELMCADSETLGSVVEQPGWRRRWSRAVAETLWASERFVSLSNAAGHDEAIVQAVLESCHALQEGLTKTVFATIRFVVLPNLSFEDVLAQGTTNLAEWAVAHDLAAASALLVPSRNAFAHHDWSIDGERVVLCELRPPAGGPVQLDAEQLEDHVLAVQEVTVAAFLGVLLAVATSIREVQLPGDDLLVATSAIPIARAILAASGWSDIEVMAGDTVRVAAEVARPGTLADLVALAVPFASSNEIAATVRTPRGRRSVSVNLASLREWQSEKIEERKNLAFIQFLHHATVDGEPFADNYQVRKLVATVAGKWATDFDVGRPVDGVLNKAKQVAENCDDDDLLRVVQSLHEWRRSNLFSGSKHPFADLDTLLNWVNIDAELTTTF